MNFCNFLIQSSENLHARTERRGPHDAQTYAGPIRAIESHPRAGALPPSMLTSPYPPSFWTSDNSSTDDVPDCAAVPVLTTRVRTCIRHNTRSVTINIVAVFCLFKNIYFQIKCDHSFKESVFKDVSVTLPKLNSCILTQTVSFSLSAEGN